MFILRLNEYDRLASISTDTQTKRIHRDNINTGKKKHIYAIQLHVWNVKAEMYLKMVLYEVFL